MTKEMKSRGETAVKKVRNIQFFRDPAIRGVEISKVTSSRHVFPKHTHDDIYAFSLITSGASYCIGKENTDLTVHQGDIVLLNPGQVHSGIPLDGHPMSYWMLYADISAVSDIAGDMFQQQGLLPEFRQMIISSPRIAGHFRNLLTAYETRCESIKKEMLLTEFLGHLFHHACDTRPAAADLSSCQNHTIDLAKDVLSENLDIGMTLETVARKIGLSRFHFIRQFKKHTGVSPHQFRIQRRIEAAKGLIRSGLPFSEIALETGFSDQSHFTNKFRHYTGATPSQYARQ